jgi:hypothetical protein|tara:strand:+ start:1364 stop:1621 length:258 start_codon:yes stop_codon:yes gene_type:complete
MAITKSTEIGQMEVVGQYKIIQVRTDTIIKEDNKVISRNFHRHTVEPNISADNLAKEHADVQTLANSGIWTNDLKTAYANYVASI